MKAFFFLFVVVNLFFYSYSQEGNSHRISDNSKKPLSFNDFGTWPQVQSNRAISQDGKFCHYNIFNYPVGKNCLVLQSTDNQWKREVNDVQAVFLTTDSKFAIFKRADTLFFMKLGYDVNTYLTNIISFKFTRIKEEFEDLIAYQVDNLNKEFVLKNLSDNRELRFNNVSEYSFGSSGRMLLMKVEEKETTCLKCVDTLRNHVLTIWSSSESDVDRYVFDKLGEQVVFTVYNNKKRSLWYFKRGNEKAELRLTDSSLCMGKGYLIRGLPQFSVNGRWIFFQIQPPVDIRKPDPNAVKVNVWSYKDLFVQPAQILKLTENASETFTAVISSKGGAAAIRIEQENEDMIVNPDKVTGDFTVVIDSKNPGYLSPDFCYWLVSLKNGVRTLLKKGQMLSRFSFSPNGGYLIYWDFMKETYVSYNIVKANSINIAHSIPMSLTRDYLSSSIYPMPVSEIAGWYKNGSAILLYDNYDIWQVDPSGVKKSVNLTNSYGLNHRIKLRFIYDLDDYEPGGIQILSGFNERNKYNGFYRIKLGEASEPELLTMGPYTYYRVESQNFDENGFSYSLRPLKAEKAKAWIVLRQSGTEAPNYFFTNDLVHFEALSNLIPQRNANWLTTELINWKQFDGKMSQGILYKPENFDSTKKYPVIFNYYEKLSHRLFEFIYPDFTFSNINIPWFVSNGYLVFTPDIHFSVANKSGVPFGECAYNSVVSAAEYLATLSYVDGKKMAIQGHSYGGGETNYIITHTAMFAAAAEAAGDSDPVSAYLTLVPDNKSLIEYGDKQGNAEIGHGRFGATLWERPDLYLKNSAVLNANTTISPLLIIHNVKDHNISFRQGVEMYMALRRLRKKVWMLQYDEGGHSVRGKDAVDYTIRLTQFFDHYLKGFLPPKWMTNGIPAKLKGIDTGYDLDTNGGIP